MLLFHHIRNRLHPKKHSSAIHVHYSFKLFLRSPSHAVKYQNACVVNKYVDGAFFVQYVLDEFAPGLLIRYVEMSKSCGAAYLGRQIFTFAIEEVGDDDERPLVGETSCLSGALTACGARDDGRLAL